MEAQFWYGMLSGSILLSLLFWYGINWTFRSAQKKHEAGKADWEKDYKKTLNDMYKKGVEDAADRFKKIMRRRFNPDRTIRVLVGETNYPCSEKQQRLFLLHEHNWQKPIGEVFLQICNPTPNTRGEIYATINFNRNLSDLYVDLLKTLHPAIGGQVKYKNNGRADVESMDIYEVSLCAHSPIPTLSEQLKQQGAAVSDLLYPESSLDEYHP